MLDKRLCFGWNSFRLKCQQYNVACRLAQTFQVCNHLGLCQGLPDTLITDVQDGHHDRAGLNLHTFRHRNNGSQGADNRSRSRLVTPGGECTTTSPETRRTIAEERATFLL